MDLDTILATTQAVATHAGTGAVLGAGTYVLASIGQRSVGAYNTGVGEAVQAVGFATAGVVAGIIGPEMFGSDISTYLHEPTLGGVALGTIGTATIGGITGFLAGISYDDDHGRILSGLSLGMYGAAAATALYWGSQALSYFGG